MVRAQRQERTELAAHGTGGDRPARASNDSEPARPQQTPIVFAVRVRSDPFFRGQRPTTAFAVFVPGRVKGNRSRVGD